MFTELSKGCDKECRFIEGFAMTTSMYFTPVYDKNGVNINPDGNITRRNVSCVTCHKKWTATTQFGDTEYEQQV